MTTTEAAERLGIARRMLLGYAQALGIERIPNPDKSAGGHNTVYDLSEVHLKAIAAERRRRLYANSELRAHR